MANPTRHMLLQMWDQINDLWFHDTLADNFERIDKHDHSGGRGVQIPTGGFADGAITAAKLAADFSDINYKRVFSGTGIFTEQPANTLLYVSESNPEVSAPSFPGYRHIYRFDPAEWGVTAGAANKMKITATEIVTGVPPGTPFYVGLYPVNGVSGGNLVLGSQPSIFTIPDPGASGTSTASGTPNVPAAGYYVIVVANYFDTTEVPGAQARFTVQVMVRK